MKLKSAAHRVATPRICEVGIQHGRQDADADRIHVELRRHRVHMGKADGLFATMLDQKFGGGDQSQR
jgi:hypothetical protein